MTNGIQNPPPRFGLEGDQLYDYVQKRYVPIGPALATDEGVWDTGRVAELIRAGRTIESALDPSAGVQPDSPSASETAPQAPLVDPVDQANKDFNAEIPSTDPDAIERAAADFEGTDANGSPVADVDGAMAPQEAK